MNSANNTDDLLPPRATPHATSPQPVFARPQKLEKPKPRPGMFSELSTVGLAMLQFASVILCVLIAVGIALAIGPSWSTVVLLAVITCHLLFSRRD